MSSIALFALLFAGQEIVVSAVEPRAADPWIQSVSARCGGATLRIEGYGAGRPLDRGVSLSTDGADVQGVHVADMAADLGHVSAAYRLEITCGRDDAFMVRINRGEAGMADAVRYKVASATIQGKALTSYSGMQPANASTFWFR